MSAPSTLQDAYLEELKDNWSANDQMVRAVQQMTERASADKLKQMLRQSVDGINKHTGMIKTLIEQAGGQVEPEHCKGMEGLVKEAHKHTAEEAPQDGKLRDVIIISQYQRMAHYGVAGLGTAAAYAKALGKSEDASQLKRTVTEIYKADETASQLAESLQQAAA